jgi:hypothetical protein
MSTMGIAAGVVLVVASLIYVLWPLVRRTERIERESVILQKQREVLLVRYEQVLLTLRDLDDDYHAGKLEQAAYEATREQVFTQGAGILAAMDEMPEMQPAADSSTEDIDAQIEAEVARYLSSQGATS